MQNPIDAMLQFDANANVDASVNGPLNFDGDVDTNTNADVKCEQIIRVNIIFQIMFEFPNALLNFTTHKLKWLRVIYVKHEVMSHQCDYSLLDMSLLEGFHTFTVKILAA